MTESHKIKVLFLTGGADLYGDNRSLLGTISLLRGRIEMMVGVKSKGMLTDELERLGVPYAIVGGIMSPALMFSYQHYSLSYRVKRKLSYWWHYRQTSKALSRVIRAFAPDIIHANNSHVFSGPIMARRFALPCVWHIREYTTLDHQAIFPDKTFFDAQRQQCHCIAITKGIFEHFEMQTGKDIQIYNGVCSEGDVQPCLEQKQRYFLYMGRIVATKGVTDMLQAFAAFCHDNADVRMVIAGDGPEDYVTELKARTKEWGIADRTDFIGFRKNVSELLRPALALIVPSMFEAMGRITAEAMLAGCYVIGRNTAGTKEMLEAQQCGTLFADTLEMSAAMRHVAAMSPDEMSAHVTRAQQAARLIYTNEHNAECVLQFYKQVLKEHQQ